MNSKMANSKLSTTEPKKQKQSRKRTQKRTKQTTRIGTESQKWRSHGGLSVGNGREGMEEKVLGISSINGR